MAYIAITLAEIQVDQPIVGDDGAGFARKVKDNLDYLYGHLGTASAGSGVPNGSFEIDSDADGIPDTWAKNLYAGGAGALETTDVAHAAKSYKFTHPGGAGNGGGYLDSDYIEITDSDKYFVGFLLKCSGTGLKNKVEIREYDKGKIYQSTQTPYDSISNPTSWTQFQYQYTPAASIRYIKVRLIGGFTDTDPGASRNIFWDNIVFGALITQPKLKITTGSFTSSQAAQTTHFTVNRYAFASPRVYSSGSTPGQLDYMLQGLYNIGLAAGDVRQWYISKLDGTSGNWTVEWDYMQGA